MLLIVLRPLSWCYSDFVLFCSLQRSVSCLGVRGRLRLVVVALPGLFINFSICINCVWNGADG